MTIPTPVEPQEPLSGVPEVSPLTPALAASGGPLASVEKVEWIERWREPGRWQITLTDPNEAALLTTPGSGITVRRDDTTLMSGWWDSLVTEPDKGGVKYTVGGWDHTVLLASVFAWPTPSAPIGDQSTRGHRLRGPAETRLLGFVQANMNRIGYPLVLPASQGRGRVAATMVRMARLSDVALTVLAFDPMLGYRIIVQDRALALEVTEGVTRASVLLSEKAGGSLDWRAAQTAPAVTRAVVGAGGEGVGRLFTETVDAVAEEKWKRPVEEFVDQRHLPVDEPDTLQEMADAADKALTDGAESSGVTLTAAGGPGVAYGVDYRVGDVVTAYPSGGGVVTDQVTAARVSFGKDGETVQVTVGRDEKQRTDSIEKRLRQVEAV